MALENLVNTTKGAVIAGILALSSLVGCKQDSVPEIPMPQPVSRKLAPELEQRLCYAPLAVGNRWTYLKTVKKPVDIFYLTAMSVIRPSKELRLGKRILLTGRPHFARAFAEQDEETYMIEQQINDAWLVSALGQNPRDGRYIDQKPGSKIQWYYNRNSVEETVECTDAGAETQRKTILAFLQLDAIVTDGLHHGAPHLSIGSNRHRGRIKVPAGTFTDCLRTVRITHCKNPLEVVLHSAAPEYAFEPGKNEEKMRFGRFMTESFYAKDIGLVKEVQHNALGEETYVLELRSYTIR